jgi:hypothetical protein
VLGLSEVKIAMNVRILRIYHFVDIAIYRQIYLILSIVVIAMGVRIVSDAYDLGMQNTIFLTSNTPLKNIKKELLS